MKLDKIKFAQVVSYISRQYAVHISDHDMRNLDELIDVEDLFLLLYIAKRIANGDREI